MLGIILLIGRAASCWSISRSSSSETKESPEGSIYQACVLGFRRILMTTMAALLGAGSSVLGIGCTPAQ